jgi:DNA helicase-2/ATP-dependent DNA helicase PcrA
MDSSKLGIQRNAKMAKIERSLGGAGTGKTRQILAKMDEAKRELGLSVEQIGFCTFTRAGRAEISERAAAEWGVDAEVLNRAWFRTAHSIAHKCCGVEEGQLIQGSEGDEWLCGALGGRVNVKLDSRGERTYVADGDDIIPLSLRAWDLARAKMSSVDDVIHRWIKSASKAPSVHDARAVIEKYEIAKRKSGKLDFTDMIARFAGVRFTVDGSAECTPEGEVPGDLRVLAIDEAQDSSHLVDRVCRRLAASDRVERIWLCGDPYQSIHSFAGGDYRLFLAWDAVESIMPKSYRCPRKILDLGEDCLRGMASGYRDRRIAAAGHDGSLRRAPSAEEALRDISPSDSTLILGRCTHSLEAYEDYLTRKGLPFAWVDKTHGSASLSGYGALWSLQHGEACRGEDWASAIAMISAKDAKLGDLLIRGEKTAWKDGKRSYIDIICPVDEDFELAGASPVLRDLIRSGRWTDAIEPKSRDRAVRWHSAATSFGCETASNPKIRLSTIHSAKGLEADNVILSSITSGAVERARQSLSDAADEECRVAYVAVTRTKQNFCYVDDGTYAKLNLPL